MSPNVLSFLLFYILSQKMRQGEILEMIFVDTNFLVLNNSLYLPSSHTRSMRHSKIYNEKKVWHCATAAVIMQMIKKDFSLANNLILELYVLETYYLGVL